MGSVVLNHLERTGAEAFRSTLEGRSASSTAARLLSASLCGNPHEWVWGFNLQLREWQNRNGQTLLPFNKQCANVGSLPESLGRDEPRTCYPPTLPSAKASARGDGMVVYPSGTHAVSTPMKLPRRNFLHLAASAAALPAVSRFAWAQTYPSRPPSRLSYRTLRAVPLIRSRASSPIIRYSVETEICQT
jgi:hypothetical protein